MAFGISSDTLSLRPSTVLQDIIQKKQLAQREKEAVASTRLAEKRIALSEAAQAEQSRQFEISQAGRGALTEHQKWLQDNWGKLTPTQQAEEARKAEKWEIEKTARQQAMDETTRITEGLQPTIQPEAITPEPARPLYEGAGVPHRDPEPAPAPVIAPTPTAYTPPKDLAGYLEQFPDRKANLEEAQSRIKPLKLTKKEKLLIDLNTLDPKDLAKSRRNSLIAQHEAIKVRRKANRELRIGIRDEHTAMRKEIRTQKKGFTPIQKQNIESVRADLNRGRYSMSTMMGEVIEGEIDSLAKAYDYLSKKGLSPELFKKELKVYEERDILINQIPQLKAEGKVVVRDKKGNLFKLPKKELKEARRKGYELVKE